MIRIACAALFALTFALGAVAEGPRVLFLSKSAGFQHSTITRKGDEPSHTEKVLASMLDGKASELTLTKDAGLINAENLKNYDVVIFYTTGDLDTPGAIKHEPPMKPEGQQELIDWIKAGGGFMGFHCASDTFHEKDGKVTPYISMIGGEFRSHGRQFDATVRVVDTDHPTMAAIPGEWAIGDEWYLFKNLDVAGRMHVLALLEPGAEREKQEMYNIPAYPIIWCSTLGDGRVYYNAMGHRERVWSDDTFQASVWDAIRWSAGEGPADAEPNVADVVPSE